MLTLYLSMLDNDYERAKMADIYERYKPLMLRYALKILNDNEQAEDAVHEAFLSIIKHKDKYFSDSCPDIGVPIVIITRNKCFDVLKRSGYDAENIDDHEYYLAEDVISPDNKIIQQEEYEVLRGHMLKLDESSINILEMRYILGMSHKEIAEITKLSLDNINKKITRAKAKIRKSYAEGCDQ